MSDEPVILWNTRDPLAGRSREQFERGVKRVLAGSATFVLTVSGEQRLIEVR